MSNFFTNRLAGCSKNLKQYCRQANHKIQDIKAQTTTRASGLPGKQAATDLEYPPGNGLVEDVHRVACASQEY